MGLFGTSGIRRIADQHLLELGLGVGLALGKTQNDVIIGRDTRTSGNSLKWVLLSGLLSTGAKCHDAGIVPTPTLAAAVRSGQIGVMITASHNPPEYNGIKIFNPDGSSYDAKQQEELEELLKYPETTQWFQMQTDFHFYTEAVENHIQRIMNDISLSKKTKVVVDCGCGAASVITPILLQRLGCEVIAINSHPSGFFPHDIEPVEKNLSDLMRICREMKTIGIAHDGDADRMMAIDETGKFIPGDKLLVLLARYLSAKSIVTTVDASMIVEETGIKVTRTKVGDTYVSGLLKKGGDFGGEPSGAWIFPGNSLCPDGIYAAALITKLASEERLSALIQNIPEYPILRGSITGEAKQFNNILDALETLKPVSIDRSDGCKLLFEDSWLLCRPSGTEPKIRITVEAKSAMRAQQIYDKAVSIITRVVTED